MHGLINKALQGFLVDAYGRPVWQSICQDAELPVDTFEVMLDYDPQLTYAIVSAATWHLDISSDAFLEDVGTWIVANPAQDPIRRLLRFGGADFSDFLMSLDELPGRAQLALPNLEVPEFELGQTARNVFQLEVKWITADLSSIIVGALRAIADDYGALVLIDQVTTKPEHVVVSIELLDNQFNAGRSFELSRAAT